MSFKVSDIINYYLKGAKKAKLEPISNAGEIEIVFERRLTDRLKVILMIDI